MTNKTKIPDEKYLVGSTKPFSLYYNDSHGTITVSNGEKAYSVGLRKLGESLFLEED